MGSVGDVMEVVDARNLPRESGIRKGMIGTIRKKYVTQKGRVVFFLWMHNHSYQYLDSPLIPLCHDRLTLHEI